MGCFLSTTDPPSPTGAKGNECSSFGLLLLSIIIIIAHRAILAFYNSHWSRQAEHIWRLRACSASSRCNTKHSGRKETPSLSTWDGKVAWGVGWGKWARCATDPALPWLVRGGLLTGSRSGTAAGVFAKRPKPSPTNIRGELLVFLGGTKSRSDQNTNSMVSAAKVSSCAVKERKAGAP